MKGRLPGNSSGVEGRGISNVQEIPTQKDINNTAGSGECFSLAQTPLDKFRARSRTISTSFSLG